MKDSYGDELKVGDKVSIYYYDAESSEFKLVEESIVVGGDLFQVYKWGYFRSDSQQEGKLNGNLVLLRTKTVKVRGNSLCLAFIGTGSIKNGIDQSGFISVPASRLNLSVSCVKNGMSRIVFEDVDWLKGNCVEAFLGFLEMKF